MLKGTATRCTDDRPCLHGDPCGHCQAHRYLLPDDWSLVRFYEMVSDQYINQAPMGLKDGGLLLTPRIEAYEATLRVLDYPREAWAWLIAGARMIHGLIHGMDRVSWLHETGKHYRDIGPEDVC